MQSIFHWGVLHGEIKTFYKSINPYREDKMRMAKSLVVQSAGSDWYYVKLPDHSFGWVMVKYTALVKPKAKG